MATSYASTVIDAPADAVWERIRDFNGLATWHGGLIATSGIEEGKAGDQVGGVRSFTLHASQVFQGGFDALKAHLAGS